MPSERNGRRDSGTEHEHRPVGRRRFLAAGAAVGTTAIAGCLGGDGDGNGTGDGNGSGGGGGETTGVAIVSSPAGFDDNAFNDLALEGLNTAAEEYDIEINQVEETEQAQYQSTQANLAQSGDYDLIVLVSYNHTEALTQNAADYSDQNWMLINDYVDEPNVAGYSWANHQMSYLAGVLGGTLTTEELSGGGGSTTPDDAQIGFVGGVDGSLINAFERAYVAGAEWVNSDVQVNVGYIGNYTDTSTAADIASSQYDDGADIVYHAAAAAGRGVFEAAQENDRLAIGVDADQSVTLSDFQDVIVGSAVKYINEGTREVAAAAAEGNFESVAGQNTLGLEDEAVDCVIGQAYEGQLPDVALQNLEDAKSGITNGDISVPCTASGCN
ncbi:BMP family lipoprotein [Halomarina oriensis]|uniref:BMP family ABC transporter substrate-binding protein n=1 Tax=Halomarina oriensis TaxID=671145 RepID=A0A6B0GX92_9EURY|nr:BMP family ABC transporter substrate-binding protein [Halomarina oriensis]MWG36378.1 BMP family ABC transporter substrate-binding protein [Halomarina oriensis]